MCAINRDLKVRPIRLFLKSIKDKNIIQYIGIAIDEPERLKRLGDGKVSLLQKYKYTESMAYNKCYEYDLLSPIYKSRSRSGCWFCPNAKISEYINTRKKYPYLWDKLRELSYYPNLCTYGFKYKETFQQIEKKMDDIEDSNKRQLTLFK